MEDRETEREAWEALTGCWELCENYTTVAWKMEIECVHRMEYIWCRGCPRINGAKESGKKGEGEKRERGC